MEIKKVDTGLNYFQENTNGSVKRFSVLPNLRRQNLISNVENRIQKPVLKFARQSGKIIS